MGNLTKEIIFERYVFRFDTACNLDSSYHCIVSKQEKIAIKNNRPIPSQSMTVIF